MRRFMVDKAAIENDQIIILGEEARHISLVLRLQCADIIEVFDGSGTDYQLELLEVASTRVVGRIIDQCRSAAEPQVSLVLVQGLAKGEKMDLIIQKAVELGVSRIIPVNTDHAVVKISGDKTADKVTRWNRISAEACKQCGRSRPPRVEEIADLEAVISSRQGRPGIFFSVGSNNNSLRSELETIRKLIQADELYLFIGPEGGFSRAEAKQAEDMGMVIAGLGPRILRTETAAIAALSVVMYEIGDLGGCR
ncbi:MAG: 16S rRNA (uracil(1498)-N(3))-methyltransferase [Ignavibacteriales bacterium]